MKRALPKAAKSFSSVFKEQSEAHSRMLYGEGDPKDDLYQEDTDKRGAVVAACTGSEPPPFAADGHASAPAAALGAASDEKEDVDGDGSGKSGGDGDGGGGGAGSGGGSGGLKVVVRAFEKVAATLEKCERDLRTYANAKRAAFPRFYFLSSAELLDVLAKGAEPLKVLLKHAPKILFDAYHVHVSGRGALNVTPPIYY